VRYTRKEIEIMREYLQQWIDLGWNAATRADNACPFGAKKEACVRCSIGRDGFDDCRELKRLPHSTDSEGARRHARWLLSRYNAADEGGEWSIE
jgi:hypothetical protein